MKNLTWQNPEQLFVAQVLINKVKSKCCGIKGEIYMAIMSELNSRLAEIRRELEDAGKNLSNMMKYINQTIEMFCKLGLWSDTNFSGSVVILGGINFC